MLADGAEYLKKTTGKFDLIFIDGFDGKIIAPELSTESFMQTARAALQDEGIFAMNLWGSEKAFSSRVDLIRGQFDGQVLLLPVREKGNVILFAFKDAPSGQQLSWKVLRQRALEMQQEFGIEYTDFVQDLSRLNAFDSQKLYPS